VLVVLQRKRAKLFHVVTVDTRRNRIEEGSWFRGKLYPLRCDVSFDGNFMVYLAMGTRGTTWNGLCRLPWLTTLIDVKNTGAWFGGGFFEKATLLRSNGWSTGNANLHERAPLSVTPYRSRYGGEDLGVIFERFERDGYKRDGTVWSRKYSKRHPELTAHYLGYFSHTIPTMPAGYTFSFSLDDYPELLDGASWATWDLDGNLWVARPGAVQKFNLADLREGKASFSIDLDRYEPPWKSAP